MKYAGLRKPYVALPTLVLWGATLGSSGVMAQERSIVVGPNVHVSLDNARRFHGEVQVAADPTDSGHLIACSDIGSSPDGSFIYPHQIAYVTFDGGAKWKPEIEKGPFGTDPSCALGPKGLALFAGMHGPVNPSGRLSYDYVYVYGSEDGGRDWLPKPEHFRVGDRDFIEIDNVSRRFYGRIYFHQDFDTRMAFSHSADGGATFSPVLEPPNITASGGIHVTTSVSLSDGTLLLVLHQSPKAKLGSTGTTTIEVTRSTDGGLSFSDPITVSSWTLLYANVNTIYAFPFIAADTSRGPYRNRVYVVWPDRRYGHGDILISHSDDEGKTWSQPTVVDDIPTPGRGPDAFNSEVAVNKYGVIGVTWYDRRATGQGQLGGWIRFAASYDGGLTFTHSAILSTAPSRLNPPGISMLTGGAGGGGTYPEQPVQDDLHFFGGPDKRFGVNGGDMMGLAAGADGIFHAVWVDNRTGVPQLWTAAIRVTGSAIKNGDPSLSALTDVTKRVALHTIGVAYNRANDTISINLAIRNTSEKPIVGPIYLRVLSMQSEIGSPVLTHSDNGIDWRGAIVKFEARSGDLQPNRQTRMRHLLFRIIDPRQIDPNPVGDPERYIDLDARAFAKE